MFSPSSPFPPPTSSPPTSTTSLPSHHHSSVDPATNPWSSPLPIAIDDNTNIVARRALSCYKSSHCTILGGRPSAAASSSEASDTGESSRSTAMGSKSSASVIRSKSIAVARHRCRASTAVGDEELIIEPPWRSKFGDRAAIGDQCEGAVDKDGARELGGTKADASIFDALG